MIMDNIEFNILQKKKNFFCVYICFDKKNKSNIYIFL